ncbi:MAG: hypothetical protein H5T59_13870, partial [Anaerolineae bacterium]|nr:hypothetical protein [Anaerolineae bacterium]
MSVGAVVRWPATAGLLVVGLGLLWPGRRNLAVVALVLGYALAGAHLAAATQEVVAPVHLLLGGLVGALLWLGAWG